MRLLCCLLAALLFTEFGISQELIQTRTPTASRSGRRIREIFEPSKLQFESGMVHYVHRDATKNVPTLTIRNLRNAEIHFLGEVKGTVRTQTPWQDDRGVVNFIDCENLDVTGLDVSNSQPYKVVPVEVGKHESTALCISRSKDIRIRDSKFAGLGKSIVVVHSGSKVSMQSCEITGYYLEVHVGASSLALEDIVCHQHNQLAADSHSAIYVSSSMRNDAKQLYEGTNVTLKKMTFNLTSGRALVSGNGSLKTRSTLTFLDTPTINHKLACVGFAILHSNYQSITINLREPYPGLVDVIDARQPGHGIGRFVIYHKSPGRPHAASPIIVDGLSSETIRY